MGFFCSFIKHFSYLSCAENFLINIQNALLYKWDDNSFPHTHRLDEDVMLGHVYYSCSIIEKYLDKCSELSDSYKLKILHIIGSHHTTRGTGSMAERKMIEALIIHKADDIDALLTPSIRAVENLKDGESKTSTVYMLKDYLISSKYN